MARRPVRFRNRSDLIKMTRGFLKNEQFINTLAAARSNKLGRTIKRLAGEQRTKQATDKFRNSRERGLSLRQLLDNVEPKIRKNSIRDKVTVINLKLTKDGQKILSRTLTYDKTKGKLQVRPHRHIITKLPSESERDNIKFARARRIKVSCDCEDFMFRHEYSLTHRWGASDIKFSNGEFPFDKNPGLAPTICKHIYCLLRYVRQNGM